MVLSATELVAGGCTAKIFGPELCITPSRQILWRADGVASAWRAGSVLAQGGPAELKFPAQIFIGYIDCSYGAHERARLRAKLVDSPCKPAITAPGPLT